MVAQKLSASLNNSAYKLTDFINQLTNQTNTGLSGPVDFWPPLRTAHKNSI